MWFNGDFRGVGSKLREVIRNLSLNNAVNSKDLNELSSSLDRLQKSSISVTKRFDRHDMHRSNPHLVTVEDLYNGPNSGGTLNGVNLIKNYPSLELATGTAPEWWDTSGTMTFTENTRTSQGLPLTTPNERVLKVTTGQANAVLQQQWSPTDEDRLMASTSKVSAGAWVYLGSAPSGIGLRVQLTDSVDGQLQDATKTISASGQWVYVNFNNVTIGANNLRFRFFHSDSGVSYYIANPVLNVGPSVIPWRPRGLVFRQPDLNFTSSNFVSGIDPGGAGWTDVDVTSKTNANCAKIGVTILYRNQSGAGTVVAIRRKGDTNTTLSMEVLRNHTASAVYTVGRGEVLVDDLNRFQYYTSAGAGASENIYVGMWGWWEWE